MLFRFPRQRCGLTVAALAAMALGATACTTSSTGVLDDSSGTSVTLTLRPDEFIGDTPCSAAAGAMRTYVATLTDRTDPEVPFTHPSSLPTPCSAGIRFDNVAAGRSYTVALDGYEQFSDEIGPEGWSVADGDSYEINYKALRSGGRHMHDQDGAPVVPRWLGSCPETIAEEIGYTPITGCGPLLDTAPSSTAEAVQVAPQDSLGPLLCAADAAPGEPSVASFDLLPQNGLPSLLGIPCLDQPFVQEYTGAAVVPGAVLDFFVDARATPGGPAVWGAACSADVQEGLTVRAACSPLSDRGSLHIDIAALLALLGVACSGDITGYDATLVNGDTTLSQEDVPCYEDISFGPLIPGDYAADVTIYAKDGTPIFALVCAAAVAPGRAATPDCVLQ